MFHSLRIPAFVAVAFVWVLTIPITVAAQDNNLLVNASFEQVDAGRPTHWDNYTWGGRGEFDLADNGRTGRRCVTISSTEGADCAWRQVVKVKPYVRYKLSAWVRTDNLDPGTGEGTLLNLHGMENIRTRAISGTNDWTLLETEFVNTARALTIHCLFGGWGQSTGQAWYDDVRLEPLGPYVPKSTTRRATVRIDTETLGHPIHEFIYGQFIEHLGRCIYGGIWAEMLEDRKFYFPITADYNPYTSLQDSDFPVVGRSPWDIVGDANKVTMVKEDSFVGEHTPRLEENVTIRQHDLGVVAGKEYTGYIWLRPVGNSATAQVSLMAGDSVIAKYAAFAVSPGDYRKFTFRFTPTVTTDKAALTITVNRGAMFIGTVSLMPADNIRGMRADTLALLKQLDAPVYRWPGGNFVSGYEWRDGIGDRDRRPPRVNPAWTGVEHNDFGLHEFIDFCREIKTEPMIAANTGFGDAYCAAAEVEYCNGSPDTYWGSRRIANGAPEPFDVKWWCVGNEMFGPWQLGFMQLSQYTIKHNRVAQAMLDVDPTLELIGVGALGTFNRRHDPDQRYGWSEGMLRNCADNMDLLSEHFYVGQHRPDPVEHVDQLAANIRRIADGHRELQGRLDNLQGRTIPIAMDEWNYWYHDYDYGELGCVYTHADALGVAVGLHEYFRNSDIYAAANYAQTVNVIGCIKTTRTDAFLSTTALPLMLYCQQYGTVPVAVVNDARGLDVAAAWTADRKAVTVGVVNSSWDTMEVTLAWQGVSPAGSGPAWLITADTPAAYNGPDHKDDVTVVGPMPVDVSQTIKVTPLTNLLVRVPVR